jgi:hypothetical protein
MGFAALNPSYESSRSPAANIDTPSRVRVWSYALAGVFLPASTLATGTSRCLPVRMPL